MSHRAWYCTLSLVAAIIGATPLGLSPVYAAGFIDTFDYGIIDTNRWSVHGYRFGAGVIGGGLWQWSFVEGGAGGYLEARVWGPTSGLTCGAEAWVMTKMNFNTGTPWLVNFRLATNRSPGDHADLFAVSMVTEDAPADTTSGGYWVLNRNRPNFLQLWNNGSWASGYDPPDPPMPAFAEQAWSIRIDPAGFASLYQSADGLGAPLRTMQLDKAKPWHVNFCLNDMTAAGMDAGDANLRLSYFAAVPEPGTMPLYALKTILDSPGCSSVDLSPDGTRIYSRINYGDWDGGYRVFDAATYAQLCDYRPGPNVNSAPWRGLVSSDNSSLYMTAYYAGAVKKLSVVSCPIAETAAIRVGSWPAFMAFDSQRRFLYVCQGDPGTGAFGSLQVIDTNTDSVIHNVPLYGEPYGVTLSPEDQFVYVGSGTKMAARLYKIRTSDLAKIGPYVMLGNGLYKRPFSLSPDGSIAYAPDPSGNGVHVVDTLNMRQLAFWPLAGIHGFFVSPDGTHAIVTGLASPLLRVFDLSQQGVVQTLDMGVNAEAHGAAYWGWRGTTRRVLLPVDTGVAILEIEVTPPEPPSVDPITGPTGPVRVNAIADVSSPFTDADSPDGHTASWNWGDGTESEGLVSETNGSGSVSGSHMYAAAGIYTIVLTVTDKDGGTGTAEYRDVTVYDPSGGFVTGGGWFDSPAGALLADPALSGKSNVGFNFKYKKGATQPSGQLEFQFKQGHLDFHSTGQDWLVVAGAKAQCMGSGMLKKGADNCGFMLTAIDGGLAADDVDRLRIQIWDKLTGDVIYDGGVVAGTLDLPARIADGSIVVHKRAGDINGDGYMNVVDLMHLVLSWGQTRGHPKYNAACDLNDDGDVDVVDLLTVAQDWGN